MSNDNKLPTYEAGDVDQPYAGDRDNDYWIAAIDRTAPTVHGGVIECYGETEEEATALRDLLLSALPAEKPAAAAERGAQRCHNCDDTGDVTSITGEWRGACWCPAGRALATPPAQAAQADGRGAWGLSDEQIDLLHDSMFPAPFLASDRVKVREFTRVAINAAHLTKAAEPARVDEVAALVTNIRSLAIDWHDCNVAKSNWAGRYWKEFTDKVNELAALTQRPAAPSEVERLRAEQAIAVMPLIGPLLDAWEWACRMDGFKSDHSELHKQLRAIDNAMEGRPAAPLATDATDAQVGESWEFHKRAGIEGTGNFNLYFTAFRAGFKAARNGR